MKHFLPALLLLATLTSFGLPDGDKARKDCMRIHTGKFKIEDETGVTHIVRTPTKQIETHIAPDGTESKGELDIFWTSECTYQLKNPRSLGGSSLSDMEDLVLTVEIKEVKKTSYTVHISANLFEQTMDAEVQILP